MNGYDAIFQSLVVVLLTLIFVTLLGITDKPK